EGLIVTADGFSVAPDITIPDDATSISINAEGEVYGYFADSSEGQLLGQFSMATFSNAKGLEAMGSNLFTETEASGPAIVSTAGLDGMGTLRQGYLEDSSVDVVQQMTDLIEAQRGYELNAKVITAVDQMMAATAQVR
ncbi:MAG: flagellar hook-basal body protein, partial [Paracoccaceae bacterium]